MTHPSEEREKSLENARATPDEGTDEAPDFWPANGKSVDQRGGTPRSGEALAAPRPAIGATDSECRELA